VTRWRHDSSNDVNHCRTDWLTGGRLTPSIRIFAQSRQALHNLLEGTSWSRRNCQAKQRHQRPQWLVCDFDVVVETDFLQSQFTIGHILVSVYSTCRTRSSSVVTLARKSVSSSLQIINHSFKYASPHLWNQLPSSSRQPHCVHSPPGSPHLTYITSSQSSPSFSPSVTPSTFHSRPHLFHKSFPP